MTVHVTQFGGNRITVRDVYEIKEYPTNIYIHSKTRNDNPKFRRDETIEMYIEVESK